MSVYSTVAELNLGFFDANRSMSRKKLMKMSCIESCDMTSRPILEQVHEVRRDNGHLLIDLMDGELWNTDFTEPYHEVGRGTYVKSWV